MISETAIAEKYREQNGDNTNLPYLIKQLKKWVAAIRAEGYQIWEPVPEFQGFECSIGGDPERVTIRTSNGGFFQFSPNEWPELRERIEAHLKLRKYAACSPAPPPPQEPK